MNIKIEEINKDLIKSFFNLSKRGVIKLKEFRLDHHKKTTFSFKKKGVNYLISEDVLTKDDSFKSYKTTFCNGLDECKAFCLSKINSKRIVDIKYEEGIMSGVLNITIHFIENVLIENQTEIFKNSYNDLKKKQFSVREDWLCYLSKIDNTFYRFVKIEKINNLVNFKVILNKLKQKDLVNQMFYLTKLNEHGIISLEFEECRDL